MKTKKEVYTIGAIIIVIVLISYILTAFYSVHARRILAAMMVVVGAVAFFGLMGLGVGEKDNNLSKSDIRLATVGAIFTVYLALVGTVSTFAPRTTESATPELTTSLITHFTTIVGVVIAFYFGTVAYEAVNKPSSTGSETPTAPKEDENNG